MNREVQYVSVSKYVWKQNKLFCYEDQKTSEDYFSRLFFDAPEISYNAVAKYQMI